MPKVEGGNLDRCMEICLGDDKLKDEYPSAEKRQDVCYAACAQKYGATEKTYQEYLVNKNK
jgi:hypothetical protein